MKKRYVLPALVLCLALTLSACASQPQPTPTATATLPPTHTPLPTSTLTFTPTYIPTFTNTPAPTDTPLPTNTPQPTNTPTTEPTSAGSASPCVISTDPTYGYTQENPIKVGGGDFGGPPRERAYLDNLCGPNGEKISYDRGGSLPFGDTILDVFEITGVKKAVALYIDEYTYMEPQAPVGFTCASAFPLSEP